MRALCGSIIAAGALIGLGLLGMGIGTRYAGYAERNPAGDPPWLKFSQMDTPFIFAMVFLVSAAVIGLAVAFIGLAYHHERRYREWLLRQPPRDTGQRVTVS